MKGGSVQLNAGISSQFISALMMLGPVLKGGISIELEGDIISSSYIRMTQALMQMPLGLASEGSFGPDPFTGLFPWNIELLMWIDDELGIEVVGMAQGPGRSGHVLTGDWAALEAYAALYAGDGSLAAGPAAYPVNRAGDLARGAVLIGSGAPLVAGPGSLVVHASAEPDIAIVAKLAARSAAPASPLYLRPPDAKAQSGYALPRRAQ